MSLGQQEILAGSCILEAALAALDPSGRALREVQIIMRDGLTLAEQMGVENVPAAEIIKQVLANLEGMNAQ